jgi:hypothetical protein
MTTALPSNHIVKVAQGVYFALLRLLVHAREDHQ